MAALLALAVALALLPFGGGGVGQAQTAMTLVSNTGQSDSGRSPLSSVDLAQSFTTGDHASGYQLAGIELYLASASGTSSPAVTLFSGSASGTNVAVLSGPTSIEANAEQHYTFRASGTVVLSPSTEYWVVAQGGSLDLGWTTTESGSEDGTPAAGWSIANRGQARERTETGAFTDLASAALLIRVNGSLASAPGSPAFALEQHQVTWTRYPEINTEREKQGFGSVVWGGGSFMKLVSKLSIEGCDVNAFIAVTPDGKKLFHHFQAPDFVNKDFGGGNYMSIIPKGSAIGFSCVDACDIIIGPGEVNTSIKRCISSDDYIISANINKYFDFHTNCIKDFTGEVERQFFSYISTFQDTCVAYFQRETSITKVWGVSYGPMSNYWKSYYYMQHKPFIIAFNDIFSRNSREGIHDNDFLHIGNILHELCHQNQQWYTNTFYNTYDNAKNDDQSWYKTSQGKEFISTIGYIYDAEEGYYLEKDNPYNLGIVTSTSPIELAAEVCAGYTLEKIYENEYPVIFENRTKRGIRNRTITPETIEWMEKYIAVTSPAAASRR